MFTEISDTVAIGSYSTPEALKDIRGYKTVIDLCTLVENNQLDESEIKGLALKYIRVPVSPKSLNRSILETFKQSIDASPQPTYVFCSSGLRSGVFSLLVLAEKEGWTEAQYLQRFQSLGIDQKPDCPLKGFAHQ